MHAQYLNLISCAYITIKKSSNQLCQTWKVYIHTHIRRQARQKKAPGFGWIGNFGCYRGIGGRICKIETQFLLPKALVPIRSSKRLVVIYLLSNTRIGFPWRKFSGEKVHCCNKTTKIIIGKLFIKHKKSSKQVLCVHKDKSRVVDTFTMVINKL